MFSIIKMDIARMFRRKSFYITHLIVILLTAMGTILSFFIQQEVSTNGGIVKSNAGMGANLFYEGGVTIEKVAQKTILSGNLYLLLIGIFVVMFISSELTSGYVKNILVSSKIRTKLILSKLVSVTILGVIFIVLNIGFVIFETLMLGGNEFVMGDLKVIIFIFLKAVIMYIAMCCVINMIVYVTKSMGISMMIVIIWIMKIPILILLPIEYYFKIDITKYLLLNNFSNSCKSVEDLMTSLVIAVIYAAVSTVIAIWSFSKADIK